MKFRPRLIASNLEPKPASTPPKKSAKPKKIQLNDGVVGLKRFLELKAQARYRPDTESDSAISVSTADRQKILLKGEDDTGKKSTGGIATHLKYQKNESDINS